MFLQQFFERIGSVPETNHNDEAQVLCPFEHAKGFETRPSAYINVNKDVFHCKTCEAEGRFNDGGLSAIGFISEYFKMPYRTAAKFKDSLKSIDPVADATWHQSVQLLNTSPIKQDVLVKRRGLTEQTIKEYDLAYTGDGIRYPIRIFDILCDIRTYNIDQTPKMRSQRGAHPMIFPFDHWFATTGPTILNAGENDALIFRQLGFNAITFTGGEGGIPKNGLLHLFSGKTVYVCYDMDDTGKLAAQRVAYFLKKAGADVRIIYLPVAGTKADKDATDYILNHNKGYEDVAKLMTEAVPFTQEMFETARDKEFELVDLWNITDGRYSGKRISSRALMSGKFDMDYHIVTQRVYRCDSYESGEEKCQKCPMQYSEILRDKRGKDYRQVQWDLENQMHRMLEMVEVDKKDADNVIKLTSGIPFKCEEPKLAKRDIVDRVQKVFFAPDVETDTEDSGYLPTEQAAYVLKEQLTDGERYRIFFRPIPHPNQKGKVYMVVDEVEASDNALNRFKVTEELKDELSIFRGDPETVMQERFELGLATVGNFARDMVVHSVNLVYHSPLRFKFLGKAYKGYPEVAIVGETRTGKSDVGKGLQRYYGLGSRTILKMASRAGLVGGMDKGTAGGFRIKWGDLVRNHKSLLIMDEMSGADSDILAQMTDVRSEGRAILSKIGGTVTAPASTRLIWMGNQRVRDGISIPFSNYPNGVRIVTDLVGAAEDIARFDAIVLIEEGEYIKPDERELTGLPSASACKRLIQWAWSRNVDQVKWDERVEDFIWDEAVILNSHYNCNVKFLGSEAHIKLARFSVAVAVMCFSSDDSGECILVKKEHVEWAVKYLHKCYDNDTFRLKEYVQHERLHNDLTREVVAIMKGLMNTDSNVVLIRELINSSAPIPQTNLQMLSGLDREMFGKVLAQMVKHYLVSNGQKGVSATQRMRKAYREVTSQGDQKPALFTIM